MTLNYFLFFNKLEIFVVYFKFLPFAFKAILIGDHILEGVVKNHTTNVENHTKNKNDDEIEWFFQFFLKTHKNTLNSQKSYTKAHKKKSLY